MSGSGSKGSSWLDRIAQLLAHQRQSPSNPRRKLFAERLERRTVLSGTPLAPEEAASGPSLEDYLEQDHAMGPLAPGEGAVIANGEAGGTAETEALATHSPALADQYFNSYTGQGEGEGEGGSSGSGSGGGGGSGSGSAASSGSGSGGGEGSSSGSGEGSGNGEGSGETSGSGEGSGGGESSNSGGNQAPTIETFWIEHDGDSIILHGTVLNDGGYSGMTINFGDLVNATITPNQYGEFTLTINRPEDGGSICVSATDAGGLTSQVAYAEYFN